MPAKGERINLEIGQFFVGLLIPTFLVERVEEGLADVMTG
jgi:hypothetical protein